MSSSKKTLHELAVEHMGLEVGDRVRVIGKLEDKSYSVESHSGTVSWKNAWVADMDSMFGKETTVLRIEDNGVILEGSNYGYPAFVLKKVEKQYVKVVVKLSDKYEAEIDTTHNLVRVYLIHSDGSRRLEVIIDKGLFKTIAKQFHSND